MVDRARKNWRDFNTDGIPGSGAYKPEKSKLRAWGTWLESFADAAWPGETKTSGYTVTVDDIGETLIYDSSSNGTFALPAAASAESGFMVRAFAAGTGELTINPDGAETINGQSTLVLTQYRGAIIWTDGSEWYAIWNAAIESGMAAVADFSALRSLSTSDYQSAHVEGEGIFDWLTGDQSADTVRSSGTTTSVASSTGTLAAHGMLTGDVVVVTSAVNGLSTNTLYYVIVASSSTFKLATSMANAKAGTNVSMSGTTNFTFKRLRDHLQGVYVIPTGGALDGTGGAWKRRYDGAAKAKWFGVNASVSDIVDGMKAAIDFIPNYSRLDAVGLGDLDINSVWILPSVWWTEDGHGALDTPEMAAIGLRNRVGVEIDLTGTRVIHAAAADGYAFYFYRCIDCTIIGGQFVGNTTLVAGSGEAAAITFARCWNCWGHHNSVDRYYRNLFIIRSTACGFDYWRSTRGGYFCMYIAGRIDVSLTNSPDVYPTAPHVVGHNTACNGYAKSGKYGNFFGEYAHYFNNTSENAGVQGVAATHVQCESGYVWIDDNSFYQDNSQNSGDRTDGIVIATSSTFAAVGAYPTGSRVRGNNINGCTVAISVTGAKETVVRDNHIAGYFLTGISVIARDIAGNEFVADGIIIDNNTIAPIASTSTLTPSSPEKKAGIQMDQLDSAIISGAVTYNRVNVNNRGAISPSGTWYETAANITPVGNGTNIIVGTGTTDID
jgi:hypothetical protein